MNEPIINLPPNLASWLATAPGQALVRWEQSQLDAAVADVFGYHALQLGLPQIPALQANRMPHQWCADRVFLDQPAAVQTQLQCDFEALPFPEASLDLVALPHALETSADPHACLRETERVLVPEGRVVITGFNPSSLWGWNQKRAHLTRRMGFGSLYLPEAGEFLGYWRLRDWLRLLGFEVESSNFGLWHPAVRSQAWLSRTEWMNRLGTRYWPIFGAAYCVVAIKRVRGMRMISPNWKRLPQRATAGVPVAPRSAQSSRSNHRVL